MGIQFRELVAWVRHRKVFASALLALTLGIGIIIGTVISGRVEARHSFDPNGAALLSVPNPVSLSNGFSNIVARVEPAVVNISTTQVFEEPKSSRRNPSVDPFQDFFHRFFNQNPDAQGSDAEKSLGSGMIVDPQGYILTNDHVIDGATKIQVSLDHDPTPYTAKVIGVDKLTDLAVIKIDAGRALPVVKLGNSDGASVGDWVLAFGSPFSLNGTVTAGIISAKNRQNIGSSEFQDFIQTDAAINPGNSGGPLVNLAGEVIGINTAIYTGSRGFEGVGFAMPSNTAIHVYDQLVTKGRVTRGSIGVTFTEAETDNVAVHKALGVPYGVIVEAVETDSPAAKAGIEAGDIITRVNGRPVRTGTDLVNPIAATPIGKTAELTLVHNGKARNIAVTVADRSKLLPQEAAADSLPQGAEDPASFGLHVQTLTPQVALHIGLRGQKTGVVVAEVDPASFADDINFSQGDVIVEMNHVAIVTMADYKREIAKLKPGADVLFKVVRGDGTGRVLIVYLAGTIPQPGQ